MRLWLLERTDSIGYDEIAGFVIRAATEPYARTLASRAASGEGKEVWLNASTTCEEISPYDNAGIILTDFRAE